jgi:hypothetical protein
MEEDQLVISPMTPEDLRGLVRPPHGDVLAHPATAFHELDLEPLAECQQHDDGDSPPGDGGHGQRRPLAL